MAILSVRPRVYAALLLLIILFAPGLSARTYAQAPTLLGGVSPAPVAGAGGVQFVSQSVDAVLSQNEDGSYSVRSEGAVRLYNTNRGAVNVTLGFPGWGGGDVRFNPAELPGFAPYTDNGALGTQMQLLPTSFAGGTQDSTWMVTSLTISGDTRTRLYTDWRQSLGTGPLLTYSFGLVPAGAWQSTMGSARITLELPDVISQEAIVAAQPTDGEDTFTFRGDVIEWLFVDVDPTVNPTVTLIAPHLWREIEATRAARATDPLNANLRLADLYNELAAAGVSAYTLEAEAALEAARRAAPDNPVPLQRLAALYRARAEQAGGDLAVLEQAVTVAEAAIAAGASDEATRSALLRDLQSLADAWAAQDPLIALDFLTRAEALTGGSDPAITEKRRALAGTLALNALQAGDTQYALDLAAAQGLVTDAPGPPYLESATLHIENSAAGRTYALTVTGDAGVTESKLGGLAARLNGAGFPSAWDAATATLTITTPGDPASWQAAGQTVSVAVGNDLELALLHDTLLIPALTFTRTATWLEEEYSYSETLQLGARAADHANQLQDEAAQRPSAWEQGLIAAVADEWGAFSRRQSVRVTTRFGDGAETLQRDWNLNLPAAQVLEWRERTTNRDNLMLLGAAIAGGLFVLLGLVWLPGRR